MSLSISHEAIRRFQGHDFTYRESFKLRKCEEREIQNFKKTLAILVNESSFIRIFRNMI